MNERIKQLRKALNLSQEQLGKRINVSKPTISLLEKGSRNATERIIGDICREFNINKQWLRTGKGEMFVQSDDSFLTELCKEYGLDDMDRLIIKSFMKLPDDSRKAIKNLIHNIVEEALAEHSATVSKDTEDIDIEKEVEEDRKELLAQKMEKTSSASGTTKEKDA